MKTTRLEAFSDGVIAIIITIMVLELRVPHESGFAALRPLLPVLLSYVLSFVNVGIYWNNHHHLLHVTEHVRGGMLWANLHLLFWLSLFPAATAWMGETHFSAPAMALYGVVLLMAAVAYTVLVVVILRVEGRDSVVARALGSDYKGKVSLALYALAIPLAFVHPGISGALYIAVTLIWLIPDRRIERVVFASRAAERQPS
ncbi:MAG TPA: TMEM175 family protein [Gemmatimonadaceae bacterium]|nr:TMEM175 family protein [Gemmatimonadaceae bacterium]